MLRDHIAGTLAHPLKQAGQLGFGLKSPDQQSLRIHKFKLVASTSLSTTRRLILQTAFTCFPALNAQPYRYRTAGATEASIAKPSSGVTAVGIRWMRPLFFFG
jgi:hypothetical protein